MPIMTLWFLGGKIKYKINIHSFFKVQPFINIIFIFIIINVCTYSYLLLFQFQTLFFPQLLDLQLKLPPQNKVQ